jgi:putative DNA-invertase from lambdoid prophage Rac
LSIISDSSITVNYLINVIDMNRVALYCRVSLSNGSQTTENQRIRLEEYARLKGWEYDIYEEQESTCKTRPVKQALLANLRNDEYSAVLIYKLDRWARSSTELILDTKELVDKGVGFISISDNLDFSTAAGKLQFRILSVFAEFERELIRERTIEGLHRAKMQGKKPGRPKGSKDKKKRRKSGYILREATKRQIKDSAKGINKGMEEYI